MALSALISSVAQAGDDGWKANCPDGVVLLFPPGPPAELCLRENLNLTVSVGQEFRIALPGNASTGASWGLRTLPSGMLLVDMTHAPHCSGGTPGCGDLTTFYFHSLKKGRGEIRLQYGRFWENTPWREQFIRVTIR